MEYLIVMKTKTKNIMDEFLMHCTEQKKPDMKEFMLSL